MEQPLGIGVEEGQTPLDPDEIAGLRPPVTTRSALNEVEALNIAAATDWLNGTRLTVGDVLTEAFVRRLHRRMFEDVWTWAGEYRTTDKNLGVSWTEIRVGVAMVVLDARAWLASGMDLDEAAVRFGHRLVVVHPFPNGNGRHSRAASDALAMALKRPAFTWGRAGAIVPGGESRRLYLTALHAADDGDPSQLEAFARS